MLVVVVGAGGVPTAGCVRCVVSPNVSCQPTFFSIRSIPVHDVYVGIRTARLVFWVISLLDHSITF